MRRALVLEGFQITQRGRGVIIKDHKLVVVTRPRRDCVGAAVVLHISGALCAPPFSLWFGHWIYTLYLFKSAIR